MHTNRAARPPMGWNSWNQVQHHVTEDVVLAAAHALVDRGLASAGYRHVVIDDGWQATRRDAAGRIQADPGRFPSGMAAVAEQVHRLGLRFGIYSAPGVTTCAGFLGSMGHEAADAEQFAAWGVDFLKYDWCGADLATPEREVELFTRMRRALDATGRDVLLSISDYGVAQPWQWARGVAEMYRTTFDIWPTWSSVYSLLNQQIPLSRLTGPGCWADPDMLQVGNGDLTTAENRSHLALWCLMAAPLFIGTNLATAEPWLVDLLAHPGLLAIDQDPLGRGMVARAVDGELMLLTKELSGDRVALLALNHSGHDVERAVRPRAFGLDPARVPGLVDVWKDASLDPDEGLVVQLEAHACAVGIAQLAG